MYNDDMNIIISYIHVPCHIYWDLLHCPGAVSPSHDDHLHWPCGEQCSDTVIDIKMRHYISTVGCLILL